MNKIVIFLISTLLPFSAHSNQSEPQYNQQYSHTDSRKTASEMVKKYLETIQKPIHNQPKKAIAGTITTLFGIRILQTAFEIYRIRKDDNCDSAFNESLGIGAIGAPLLTIGIYLLYDVFTAKDNAHEEEPNIPNIVTK
jgi:hypothetical protein